MIRLAAPDPDWPTQAAAEAARWDGIDGMKSIHHIGSTAVPGLIAKPILDLMPVFTDADAMEASRPDLERLGYEWMGAYGLPGRRYVRRDDPETGERLSQAHCYAEGHEDIRRHLAFRDALRSREDLRMAYGALKSRCASDYGHDAGQYADCKSDWIKRVEAEALA